MVSSVTPSFAQSKTMTAQEQANLKVVLDWWREVLQAGHVELAEKYQTEDYIQHNPGINTGRAEFVKVFSRRAPRDIKPVLDPAPVIQFAKGPYVVLVWEREGKDPKDGSAYKFNFFDASYYHSTGQMQQTSVSDFTLLNAGYAQVKNKKVMLSHVNFLDDFWYNPPFL